MSTALEPQAALEQAVLEAIGAQLSYSAEQSGRTFDGRPPARAGGVWVAVWGTGRRTPGKAMGTALDQVLDVMVTVSIRLSLPFDRWVRHRDDLEARLNAIIAVVNRDRRDFSIARAANVLAGYRTASQVGASTVGFCEGLRWEETQAGREVGGEWFAAGGQGNKQGWAQTARFGGARHLQASATAR